MRLPIPALLLMVAPVPSAPRVTFLALTPEGVILETMEHGLWVTEPRPAQRMLEVHAAIDTVSYQVLFPRRQGGGKLVLSDVPLDCAALQDHARRLGAATDALAAELDRRGVEPAPFGGDALPLGDPQICSLVDAIVAEAPAVMLPRPDGAWVYRGTSLQRWSGWEPASGWDADRCRFDRDLRWRGHQDDWSIGRDGSFEVQSEAAGRVRGRASAWVSAGAGTGWIGGTFDVPVCEVETLPVVHIDARR